MTQKQVSVLWLTDDHPNIAQTDLAKRMRMDRATTMGPVVSDEQFAQAVAESAIS